LEIKRTLLNVSNFDKSKIHEIGIVREVPIARLLLHLNTAAKNLSYDGEFGHIHEDSLYEPVKQKFVESLPDPRLVLIKNKYPEKMLPKETDISIRKIGEVERKRKSKGMDCTHYIEIKSLFVDEELPASKIDHDLIKLSELVKEYRVVGLFVLVGLENDIIRRSSSLSKLGKLGVSINPFSITTNDGEIVWLNPLDSHNSDEPFVYVWEVSFTNDFDKRRTSFDYATFQYK
jgi:hypothetical protein